MGRWVDIYKGAEDGIVGHLMPRLAPFASWFAEFREPDDAVGEAVEQLLQHLVSGSAPPIVQTPA